MMGSDCTPKILHLISSGGFYGAERMVVQLSLALESLGCSTLLGVFRNEPRPNLEVAKQARAAGLSVVEIPCRGRVDPVTAQRIRSLTAEFQADVVHSHGYKPNIYAMLALGTARAKLVSTCHGYVDDTVAMRVNEKLNRFLLRRYHAVAAVSEEVRDILIRSGVPSKTVHVVHNGINCDAFVGGVPSLSREGAGFLVGFVGRLVPLKNPEAFITVARDVVSQIPNARFAFVGEGSERSKLESLRDQWGLNESICFVGFRQDMPGVYASLDALVLPSIHEGMPMTILEALAAATPVVATRVGAVGDVVIHGQTGILVTPGNQQELYSAVMSILQDHDLARRLGTTGQRWVKEHFSHQTMASEYLRLYQRCGTRST
jgi:glycosyltransferase involved in cell wall biosynthesis